jgi:outer membrane lipoprotein-sorting protein
VKKLISLFVALCFVIFLAAPGAAQMTADEILAKHLEKTGGLEKYKQMKTMYMEGKFFAGQMTGDMTLSQKAPNLMHMKIVSPMFTMIQGSDGKNVWQQMPMVQGYIFTEAKDLPSELERNLMNPYLDYKERGAKAKLLGQDSVKGAVCYKLEYVQASGDTSYLFIDTTDFTIRKQVGKEGETIFSNFKDVGGFMFPHKITQSVQGQNVMMVMNKVEVNIPLADSLFAAPPDSLRADPAMLELLKKQMQQQQGGGEGEEKKQ